MRDIFQRVVPGKKSVKKRLSEYFWSVGRGTVFPWSFMPVSMSESESQESVPGTNSP